MCEFVKSSSTGSISQSHLFGRGGGTGLGSKWLPFWPCIKDAKFFSPIKAYKDHLNMCKITCYVLVSTFFTENVKVCNMTCIIKYNQNRVMSVELTYDRPP